LSVPFIAIAYASKMAYYGTNGYGDDAMDTESSGPKVTVREVWWSICDLGEIVD